MDILEENKVKYSAPIAEEICLCADGREFPPKIKELLDRIDRELEVS